MRQFKRLIANNASILTNSRNLPAQLDIDAVTPSIARRKLPHDREAYRQRNLIERMFARAKDFRRVATRYDTLARKVLAGLTIAATVIWWPELSPDPSTTLADLLTPLFVANPFSAMRTSLRWWAVDEFENGLAHGGQGGLRRRPVDSFFPVLLF